MGITKQCDKCCESSGT